MRNEGVLQLLASSLIVKTHCEPFEISSTGVSPPLPMNSTISLQMLYDSQYNKIKGLNVLARKHRQRRDARLKHGGNQAHTHLPMDQAHTNLLFTSLCLQLRMPHKHTRILLNGPLRPVGPSQSCRTVTLLKIDPRSQVTDSISRPKPR